MKQNLQSLYYFRILVCYLNVHFLLMLSWKLPLFDKLKHFMYSFYLQCSNDISLLQGLGKILVVLCVVFDFNIFEKFGQPTPSFWIWLISNKIYACLMIFFLSNAVEGQLISTGAFEIQYNGKTLYTLV